jgi:hypothetical protein
MIITIVLSTRWAICEIRAAVLEVANEVKILRVDSRARISTAKMRNTPETEESKLIRLGRATRAKRVVVGGDPESRQFINVFINVGGKKDKINEEVNNDSNADGD